MFLTGQITHLPTCRLRRPIGPPVPCAWLRRRTERQSGFRVCGRIGVSAVEPPLCQGLFYSLEIALARDKCAVIEKYARRVAGLARKTRIFRPAGLSQIVTCRRLWRLSSDAAVRNALCHRPIISWNPVTGTQIFKPVGDCVEALADCRAPYFVAAMGRCHLSGPTPRHHDASGGYAHVHEICLAWCSCGWFGCHSRGLSGRDDSNG